MATTTTIDPQCGAFQAAIEVLGRPWTALILSLLQPRPLRFSEIAAGASGASDKILSARLKDLEARGLLARVVDTGPPIRVTYSLTGKGRAFGQVAAAIERWGRELLVDDAKPKRARRAR